MGALADLNPPPPVRSSGLVSFRRVRLRVPGPAVCGRNRPKIRRRTLTKQSGFGKRSTRTVCLIVPGTLESQQHVVAHGFDAKSEDPQRVAMANAIEVNLRRSRPAIDGPKAIVRTQPRGAKDVWHRRLRSDRPGQASGLRLGCKPVDRNRDRKTVALIEEVDRVLLAMPLWIKGWSHTGRGAT